MSAIYHLTSSEHVSYDQYAGFVIRADSEQEARAIANVIKDDAPDGRWLDPARSTCNIVSTDGESSIILASFRAG